MAQITKPYTFTNGTKADPTQVNADFDPLYTQINSHDTQIANLSGITANMWFNVKDPKYGARGDGVSDDTATIQAAINAANAAGGGIVYFPSGTYLVSNTINLFSNMTIQGSGRGVSIIKPNMEAKNIFSAINQSKIVLKDFEINGNSRKGNVGVYFGSVIDFIIQNLHIHDLGLANTASPTNDSFWGGMGIVVHSDNSGGVSSNGIIRDCKVERIAGGGNLTGDGIYTGGDSAIAGSHTHHIIIEDCWVSTVGRHAYVVAGTLNSNAHHITIKNCFAEKTAFCAIDIEIGQNVRVDSNHFLNCGNDQTYFNPAVAYGVGFGLLWAISMTNNMSDIDITYNEFVSCYGCISASATDKVRIIGNKTKGTKTPAANYADFHLFAGDALRNSIIADNILDSGNFDGIRIAGTVGKDIIIRDNIIMNMGGKGLNLSIKEISVVNNEITGCTGTGIYSTEDFVQISLNRVKNNARGIHIFTAAPNVLNNIIISGNRCWDDRTTKLQDYGVFYEVSTGTIDYVLSYGNNFRGNINVSAAPPGINSINVNNMT